MSGVGELAEGLGGGPSSSRRVAGSLFKSPGPFSDWIASLFAFRLVFLCEGSVV